MRRKHKLKSPAEGNTTYDLASSTLASRGLAASYHLTYKPWNIFFFSVYSLFSALSHFSLKSFIIRPSAHKSDLSIVLSARPSLPLFLLSSVYRPFIRFLLLLLVCSVRPSFPAYAIDDQSIGIPRLRMPRFLPSFLPSFLPVKYACTDRMLHPSIQPFVRPSIPRGSQGEVLNKVLFGVALSRGPNPSPWKVPLSQ